MIQPRWHKVLSDLWSNKTRTILAVLSISVGVFAIGLVTGMYFIFVHDLDAEYESINPHHATIYTSLFDEAMLNVAMRVPGVAMAEGRSSLTAQVEVQPDKWQPIQIWAIPALDEIHIDQIRPVGPVPPLRDHEVYIDRSNLSQLPVKAGHRARAGRVGERGARLECGAVDGAGCAGV